MGETGSMRRAASPRHRRRRTLSSLLPPDRVFFTRITSEWCRRIRKRVQACRQRGPMAFAASVGEAILLQFQAYAEQAVVSMRRLPGR